MGTEESPTENEDTRTDSPNTKITAKQNAINTATHNIHKILTIKRKVIHRTRGSSQLPSYMVILWLRTMSIRTGIVVVKHFSGVKTKDMNSYVIPTVKQKPDNIILLKGTNNLKTIDTPEGITMGVINLTMTCKTDTNTVFISGIVPRSDNLNEKASKVNSTLNLM